MHTLLGCVYFAGDHWNGEDSFDQIEAGKSRENHNGHIDDRRNYCSASSCDGKGSLRSINNVYDDRGKGNCDLQNEINEGEKQ